jgi:glyoxylase-like metal-dependent hydrolase (beta-lactamase superfamily II)
MNDVRTIVMAVGVCVAAACVSAPPEQQAVNDVAEAMGGAEAILAVSAVSVNGSGTGYVVGQGLTPDVESLAGEGTYQSQLDLTSHRLRTETTTNAFGFPLTTVAGLDGDIAFDAGGFAAAPPARIGGTAVERRRAEYYHHPVALLQAALTEDPAMAATIGPVREEMGHDVIPIATADGIELSLHVDQTSGLPMAITSMVYDTNLGNAELSTTFSDWVESGGVQMPGSITQTLAGAPIGEWTVTHGINADVGDLSAPADVAAAPEPDTPVPNVVVDELADGVWFLGGESHHSVLVALDDYAVLVEAPLNDARTLAVIEQARALVPDMPLQYVVNTHHHFDHSGGIRAAVAEGLTVVTHEMNEAFYTDMTARSHSLAPDRLQTAPMDLSLELVPGDDVLELGDGGRTLQVFRVADDPHNAGMLVAFLPDEGILIEGDIYTPGGFATDLANFAANIERRGLDVETIAPIHGEVVPFSQFEDEVAQ